MTPLEFSILRQLRGHLARTIESILTAESVPHGDAGFMYEAGRLVELRPLRAILADLVEEMEKAQGQP